VFSPTTRKSPRGAGTSTSQDDESARSIVESLRNRKAPPNTRASGDDRMGGAYSKEQGGPGNGIVVDTPMAAAASTTLLYQLKYGGDDAPDRSEASNGKKASAHSGALDLCASSVDNIDYKPDGLVFSDDEDFLLDIDYDSEEERLRSSFTKNKMQMNIIPGGPQPPDLSMNPESEQQAVLDAYIAKRKSIFCSQMCHGRKYFHVYRLGVARSL
jgi:hypothetical protein